MKKIINKNNGLYIIFFVIVFLLISIFWFLKVRNLYANINEQSIHNNSNEVNNDESINEQNKLNISLDNTTGDLDNKQESNKINKNNNVVNNLNKENESNDNTTNDSNKEDESNDNTTNDSNKEDESNDNTTNDSNKEDESNDNTINDSTSNAPIVEKCVFNGELVQGAEYNDGTYIYRYQQKGVYERFENASTDIEGWGVIVDPSHTPGKVVKSPCSIIGNKPIVYTNFMFYKQNYIRTLDLSNFDTSNVVDMEFMFYQSRIATLDLSNFNTKKVTSMAGMFCYSHAETIDLSSFDTSNVTDMRNMFEFSKVTILDLSSFDMSNVKNTFKMFENANATTGYARTQSDADKLNNPHNKPSELTFIVKP